MREESERACDDVVLSCGVPPADYAEQVLILARTLKRPARALSAALAMARPSNFERRLIAMLSPSMNRRRPTASARLLTVVASLCLLLALAAVRAPGQGVAGTYSGTVFDPTGAVVPGVTVSIYDEAGTTPVKQTTTTDAAGNFLFSNLPAGDYRLTAMAEGFDFALIPMTLFPGRNATTNVTLNLARVRLIDIVSAPGTARPPQISALARIRVGGNVRLIKLVQKIKPEYPARAQAEGIQGTVELEATIGKDGAVLSLHTLSRGTDADLAEAAVNAVRQWRYTPTLLNGAPVEVVAEISVQFMLSQ
jgi:TonB family protein